MTDCSPQLPDAAIERALARRAPHGADAALMTEIVGTAGRTRQRRSWWPPFGSARIGPRLTLAWVAVGLAGALTVGALVAGGIRHDRPDLSAVAPVPTTTPQPAAPSTEPSPSASPDPSPSPRPDVTPAPADLSNATSSRLPASAAGLATLLPTQLCGEPATIRTDLGLTDPIPGEPTGQGGLRTIGFEGMLAPVGGPAARSLYAVASTDGLTGSCPMFGVIRVFGAYPYVLMHAFEHAVWRVDPGPCSTRILQTKPQIEDIVQCNEGARQGYYFFQGDAVVFFEATSDQTAETLLRDFARRAAITYRSAFHLPFTIALERQWRVASDGPDEVNLTDADYPGSTGATVTISLPYGFRDTTDLLQAIRTLRYPSGTRVTSACLYTAYDPRAARLAKLTGMGFSCDGEGKAAVRPFYPRSSQGVATGVPDEEADPVGNWFVLTRGEAGQFFVTEVSGTPVVIVIHANMGWGKGGFGSFIADAEELLGTLKFVH